MESVNRRYAVTALRYIKRIEQGSETEKKLYGALCHKFPAMVLTNGLWLTAAFFRAKKKVHKQLLDDIFHTAGLERILAYPELTLSMSDYRLATRKALAASVWFKRYAESVLGVDQADANDVDGAEVEV